ncbi:hypothetical protein GCM10020331_070040 [Ectobacillus funiculus]
MKLASFDFWQKFGKALIVVVAVMPAAGLMVSIGKLIGMMGGDMAIVESIAHVVEDIGWGLIGNLHILFAVAIGGILGKGTCRWCVCRVDCFYPHQSYYRGYFFR